MTRIISYSQFTAQPASQTAFARSLTFGSGHGPSKPAEGGDQADIKPRKGKGYRDPGHSYTMRHLVSNPGAWLMRRLRANITEEVIPPADDAKLTHTLGGSHAVFVGPNHPEFFTDWMLDTWLSARYNNKMAFWASAEVIQSMGHGFWLANTIIGNNGGPKAVRFSIDWASKGHPVLLHPEGNVRWNGSKVHELIPGIGEMGIRAALEMLQKPEGERKPVLIQPIVWKLTFNEKVFKPLAKEIDYIEEKLGLPSSKKPLQSWWRGLQANELSLRFKALQISVLQRQMDRLGMAEAVAQNLGCTPSDLGQTIEAQPKAAARALGVELMNSLVAAYPNVDTNGSPYQVAHRIYKEAKAQGDTIKAMTDSPEKTALMEQWKLNNRKLAEVNRLLAYDEEVFQKDHLTQEDVAESLKMIRQALLRGKDGGTLDEYHAMVPSAVGPRTAHIRAVEAIDVTRWLENQGAIANGASHINPDDENAVKPLARKLVTEMQALMDADLKRLNGELHPDTEPYAIPNPFNAASGKTSVAMA